MAMQYIYGTDTVSEGFRKINENFQSVPDTTKVLEMTNKYADTKKAEAVEESKEYINSINYNTYLITDSHFQVWQDGTVPNMWYVTNAGSGKYNLENIENGIKITATNGFRLSQYLSEGSTNLIKNQSVTMTVKINIISGQWVMRSGQIERPYTISHYLILKNGVNYQTVNVGNFQRLAAQIQCTEDGVAEFEYVGIVLGNFAGILLPLSYEEELARCQRFYLPNIQRSGFLYYVTADKVYFNVPLPIMNKSNPTVTVITAKAGNSRDFTWNIIYNQHYTATIEGTKTGHGLTTLILAEANLKIDAREY